MRRLAVLLAVSAVFTVSLPAQRIDATGPTPARGRTLEPFKSEAELRQYLLDLLGPWRQPSPSVGPAAPPMPACTSPAPLVRSFRRGSDSATGTTPRDVIVTGSIFGGSKPLFGANVTLQDLRISVGTGEDGRFRFEISAESLVVRRSFLMRVRSFGYVPRLITVRPFPGDSIDVHFELCQDINRLSQVVVTGVESGQSESGTASITNVQHEGVDEGGIVKLHAGHLVVLRHGRLYSIAIDGDQLRPVASIDAYPRGLDAASAWYDEMLLHGDKIVVVGYNYDLEATEVSLFRLDRRGSMRRLSTHHLRTDDYYSSRNYAARLVDGKLVLYAGREVDESAEDPLDDLPTARRWAGDLERGEFRRIASPSRVYRVAGRMPTAGGVAFHSVTTCDIGDVDLDCASDVVIGPSDRVFYVSPTAVYVWAAGDGPVARTERQPATGMLYRLPLDHTPPTAVGVHGSPIDQFSFREDADGMLNVLVEPAGDGDWMWNAESRVRSYALMRFRASDMGDGSSTVPSAAYRGLPSLGSGGSFHQRFVGRYLLYGNSGGRYERPGEHEVIAAEVTGPTITRIRLPHGVDRIEVMGRHAVVVGSSDDALRLTAIRLGSAPAAAHSYELDGTRQGEERSHGFFYRDDGESGVIGLPVRNASSWRYESLLKESAAVLLIRNTTTGFRQLGYLAASVTVDGGDECDVSCADWYGNSRPLFIGERVFALLGFELVEGTQTPYGIHERRRVDFRRR